MKTTATVISVRSYWKTGILSYEATVQTDMGVAKVISDAGVYLSPRISKPWSWLDAPWAKGVDRFIDYVGLALVKPGDILTLVKS